MCCLFKQNTAYELRISGWSSDVCSSDLSDLAAIWRHWGRYFHNGGVLIEPRLRSHPILAAVMPDVLHTVRVVTHLRPEPVVVGAALRVGGGKGPADNLAQGGIVVPVDVETGLCGRDRKSTRLNSSH